MILSSDQIAKLGFAHLGTGAHIDSEARFIGAERLAIGSHVRIDAQVLISCPGPHVTIGDHVHLAVGCLLFCGGGMIIESFVGISARASLFSETDDFTDGYLTGPTIPREFRKVHSAPICVGKHVVVGAGSVVMPGVTIGTGATVGALSLVRSDVEPFAVVAGTPARKIGVRNSARLQELERLFAAK